MGGPTELPHKQWLLARRNVARDANAGQEEDYEEDHVCLYLMTNGGQRGTSGRGRDGCGGKGGMHGAYPKNLPELLRKWLEKEGTCVGGGAGDGRQQEEGAFSGDDGAGWVEDVGMEDGRGWPEARRSQALAEMQESGGRAHWEDTVREGVREMEEMEETRHGVGGAANGDSIRDEDLGVLRGGGGRDRVGRGMLGCRLVRSAVQRPRARLGRSRECGVGLVVPYASASRLYPDRLAAYCSDRCGIYVHVHMRTAPSLPLSLRAMHVYVWRRRGTNAYEGMVSGQRDRNVDGIVSLTSHFIGKGH